MNGDILTTLEFDRLAEEHRRSGAVATLAVKDRTVQVEYGVVHADADRRLERLEEKPRMAYTVSMGVYAFDARIVSYIQRGERIDFPDLLTRVRREGEPVVTYPFAGYWRDIGNRDDYEAAIADFGEDPSRFLPESR